MRWRSVVLMLVTPWLTGCAIVGTSAIRGGRAAYNDALIATNNQQVLAEIVRARYLEPGGLLAVASVTANMRIQASAGAEVGFGPRNNYQGNLVPLSAGVLYEENPTISYIPVHGQDYLRQFLSPIPLDLALLLLRAMGDSPHTMSLLLNRVNGIKNPVFLTDPTVEPDSRFERITAIFASLHATGQLFWAEEPGEPPTFVLLLRGEGSAYAKMVTEMFSLLDLPPPGKLDGIIRLPVHLGVAMIDEPSIWLTTRSVFDLIRIAAASIDVPEDHVESGLAPALPPVGPAAGAMHIYRSKDPPADAMAAVRYHGWWYYIDGTDTASKQMFRLIESLISVRMADAAKGHQATPLLTVPVSR